MKKSSIILVVLSLMLGAGLFVAGCVSDTAATEQTQTPTTTIAADAGTQPSDTPQAGASGDMKAGNMTRPEMSGTMPSGTPPSGAPDDMKAGNMTRPEMSGTMPSGTPPSGTPPSGTPPTGTS